ncbi:TldD/PmbA family protein [Marinitoga litoralis]|uniref:TldD/PmbA family protein n=1 Tax=Marinitoga litoralis TaxID=570855 RepID=UPI001960F839|nr:TldD/PmbA family protein [Marinitoga litoralis]MBM7560203.1 TldD protein [Marinitoga litoralis]
MFKFPKDVYVDIRIENVFETIVQKTLGRLEEFKERRYSGAFIRLFDGKRWYYSSTTDVENIQKEIDELYKISSPSDEINEHPIVKKFEVHNGSYLEFEKRAIDNIEKHKKLELVEKYIPIVSENQFVKLWKANYVDKKIVKRFISSKGSDFKFDFQRVGFRIFFELVDGDKKFSERFDTASNYFEDLYNLEDKVKNSLEEAIYYMKNAEDVEPGQYTVILSPEAAGVFAHESFGHKSEADFMIGDENMKKEWSIGKKVGSDILSIVDDGNIKGVGYTPFDDDGTKAKETYLVKNGVLSGRLHSAITAVSLNEELTGNARALNFEFEPIVRMTTTYIKPGEKTLEELISEVDNGFLIKTIKHGSGMSTFTIAPSLAYNIKNGKIDKPVKISVITGTVFDTLNNIDGLSNELELLSFALGGCGKFEQYPLPVGFGGPYVRVKNMNVQ